MVKPAGTGVVQGNTSMIGSSVVGRLRGATVARLTPDQKVACSNHVGVNDFQCKFITFNACRLQLLALFSKGMHSSTQCAFGNRSSLFQWIHPMTHIRETHTGECFVGKDAGERWFQGNGVGYV